MREPSTDAEESDPPIPGEYDGGHPATELFSLLGRSHAMAILFYVVRQEQRPWRFSELERTLGISPNTLSNRLAELVDAGLLERRSYDEIPPRVEYEATQRALDLASVFEELRNWAETHGLETGMDADGE
ncbi:MULTISPECIES: winged helix-turn-helix transcriptional regulator [Salinibaculum]|uniref:winged helix-turn-helix transcriptional regulator n=1 Tax=Salinibaculum TaxID=2732368 RepID=UPI0030CF2B11